LPRMLGMSGVTARRGLAIAAAVAIPLGLAPAASAHDNGDRHGAASADVRSGYYTQWSVYSGFTAKSVIDDGDAAHLNEINYAFINVAPNTNVAGNPVECVSGDPWADYQIPFGMAGFPASVDGTAGTWSGLEGNFKQLIELKKKYPNIRVVASLGGWTWSSWFSDAALTEQSRQHLVQSCVDMLIKGDLPGLPAGAAKGVFDGIDIDWEYPAAAGNSATTSTGDPTARPEDTANFTSLLGEFRHQLDQVSDETDSEHYLLTAALSASPSKIGLLQVKKISKVLDQLNVMDYDFHGPWEATGPTNFQSELFTSSQEPAADRVSVDQSINNYLAAGADRRKLIVGVPFYGHGWTGVEDGGTHGLYQPATGPTADGGTANWNVISKLGYQPHRDATTGGYWVYDAASKNLYVVDDPREIVQKMQYVTKRDLGGAFYWSLDGDDSSGSLGAAVDLGLAGH
jgi:chitinase